MKQKEIIYRGGHIIFLSLFVVGIGLAQATSNSLNRVKSDSAETEKKDAKAEIIKAPATTQIRPGRVRLTGSVRARLESWDWFETSAADNDYNFGAVVVRLGLSQQTERFDWQIEGEFPWLINVPTNAIAPGAQGQSGVGATYFAASGRQDASAILKQAFFRFKGIGTDKASQFRFGRFEFSDGAELTPADASLSTIKRDHIAQRLIGGFGFTHVGRSFDGVHYGRTDKAGNFTFVAARPTEGVFQLEGNRELDVDFYYGAFTRPFKAKISESELRAFVVHYHDGRRVVKTDNRSQAVRTADLDKVRMTTVGGHFVGVYQAGTGKADVLFWGAGQFGNWGSLTHRAGAIAVEAGYQFSGRVADKFHPWFRGGYFRSTGDGDATDGTHNTFFQMLPTPRIYARTPFYNLMNNEDAFAQLRIRPHARLALRTDVHHLRLSNENDMWYLGGGAFQRQSFGYVGRSSGGQRTLGTLLDVSADYNVTGKTTLAFYFGGIRGGSVPGSIYPEGRNARFTYFEITQRF